MPKTLPPEVADRYELVGLREAGEISHPVTGKVDLSQIDLKTANKLALAGMPYLKAVPTKTK